MLECPEGLSASKANSPCACSADSACARLCVRVLGGEAEAFLRQIELSLLQIHSKARLRFILVLPTRWAFHSRAQMLSKCRIDDRPFV